MLDIAIVVLAGLFDQHFVAGSELGLRPFVQGMDFGSQVVGVAYFEH